MKIASQKKDEQSKKTQISSKRISKTFSVIYAINTDWDDYEDLWFSLKELENQLKGFTKVESLNIFPEDRESMLEWHKNDYENNKRFIENALNFWNIDTEGNEDFEKEKIESIELIKNIKQLNERYFKIIEIERKRVV